jgi:uridylate kinase
MAKYVFGKTIVVALGGSIVHPDGIDTDFLKRFKGFVEKFLRQGAKFIIVVGGGQLARRFQAAAHKISPLADEDKDWIGIHSTRLNGHLLRTVFRDIADPVVFDSRGKIKKLKYPITIASGWRPGWSTDFVAAAIAHDLKIPEFVVAGKPAYVYTADPGVHKNAKPFETIAWKEYRKLIPTKWAPGSHAPVDPIAAKLSDRAHLKSIIIHGKDLKNFENLLKGKEFKGTIIG